MIRASVHVWSKPKLPGYFYFIHTMHVLREQPIRSQTVYSKIGANESNGDIPR